MRPCVTRPFLIVLCAFFSGVAGAQISAVKGTPFQATKTMSALSDGKFSTISHIVARNSNGSTYEEMPDRETGAPAMIIICDAVNGRTIVLDVKLKFYTVTPAPSPPVPNAPSPEEVQKSIEYVKTLKGSHTSQDGVETTVLGVRTQEGFIESGQRTVMQTLPPSSKLKEKVWEIWSIPSLSITAETTGFDTDNKPVQTTKITNIQTTEPDPNLFEIPPGYLPAPVPPLPLSFRKCADAIF
jgi:hypothetical protein